MEKRQKAILIGASLFVLIVGIFFARKSGAMGNNVRKPLEEEIEEEDLKDIPSSGSGSGGSTNALPNTPFKSREEGDKFRKWVREKYPNEAAKMSGGGLDATGDYNNVTMKEAWAKFYKEYLAYLTTVGAVAEVTKLTNQTQSNLNTSGNYKEVIKVTPRKQFEEVTVRATGSTGGLPVSKLRKGEKVEWISTKTNLSGEPFHKVKMNNSLTGYVLATAVDKVKTYVSLV